MKCSIAPRLRGCRQRGDEESSPDRQTLFKKNKKKTPDPACSSHPRRLVTHRAFRKLPMNLRHTTAWPHWRCELHLFCRGDCTGAGWQTKKADTIIVARRDSSAPPMRFEMFFCFFFYTWEEPPLPPPPHPGHITAQTKWIQTHLAGGSLVGRLQPLRELAGAVAGCGKKQQRTAGQTHRVSDKLPLFALLEISRGVLSYWVGAGSVAPLWRTCEPFCRSYSKGFSSMKLV